MKTKIIGKILLSLGLMFVLVSAITPVHGDGPAIPVVTIQSTGDVLRGKIGSFVLDMKPALTVGETAITFGGGYVNFSVSGTALPGVDYVPLVSPTPLVAPANVGSHGYGVILVETLPDPRASSFRRGYDVVVTLEPGPGYAVGEPKSAKMTIKPSASSTPLPSH
jgi:hypothetical protein